MSLLISPVCPLPIYLDSWISHSRFLCNFVLHLIELYYYYQSPQQPGIVFALPPSCHSFWNYFSTLSSSFLGTYRPGEFLFQCPIFLPFHAVQGVLEAGTLEWLAVPLVPFRWTMFCQHSPPCAVRLGWPYSACLIVSLT